MGTEGAGEKQNYKNNKGSVVVLLDPRQYSKTRFGFFNSYHSHGNFREAVLEMGSLLWDLLLFKTNSFKTPMILCY